MWKKEKVFEFYVKRRDFQFIIQEYSLQKNISCYERWSHSERDIYGIQFSTKVRKISFPAKQRCAGVANVAFLIWNACKGRAFTFFI